MKPILYFESGTVERKPTQIFPSPTATQRVPACAAAALLCSSAHLCSTSILLSLPISALLHTAAVALLCSSARGRAPRSPLPDGAASGRAPSPASCFALPLPPPLLCFLLRHRRSPRASSSLEPKPLPPFRRHAAALLPLARSAPRRRSCCPTSTALKRRRRWHPVSPLALFPFPPLPSLRGRDRRIWVEERDIRIFAFPLTSDANWVFPLHTLLEAVSFM